MLSPFIHQHQRDRPLLTMRGQPVGKTGLADKASLSIRPVGAVLQLTLFVEHNNIASLQLPGQAAGDPQRCWSGRNGWAAGFADDIHEELRLFAVDNPVRDGEAHQQRQAERTWRGEAPAAARVFHRQPAHRRPNRQKRSPPADIYTAQSWSTGLCMKPHGGNHQHGDKPQQTNAQVDHPVDAQRFRAGLCGLQRVASRSRIDSGAAQQNIGRRLPLAILETGTASPQLTDTARRGPHRAQASRALAPRQQGQPRQTAGDQGTGCSTRTALCWASFFSKTLNML